MPAERDVIRVVDDMVATVNLCSAIEGLVLAAKAGLDPALVTDVLRASSGTSTALATYAPQILAHDFTPRDETLADRRASLEAALDLGRRHLVPTPLAALVHGWVLAAIRRGLGDRSPAALVTLYEDLAALRLSDVPRTTAPGLRSPVASGRDVRVGFLGLGRIGRPIAENVLRAGFPLVVWNRSAPPADALAAQGAQRAATPAEVAARCDVVLTCLLDDAAVEHVYLDADGLLAAVRPGHALVDLGTTGLALVRRLDAAATAAGATFLDAPISGGVPAAIDGTLTIMVGASDEGFARASPVLAAAGKRLFHLGAPGAGQIAKQANNAMNHTNVVGLCEGFVLARAVGVPYERLLDAILAGRGASFGAASRGAMFVARDLAPHFTTHGRIKDGKVILSLGAYVHAPLPLNALCQELHEAAAARGASGEDWVAVGKVYEWLAGDLHGRRAP